MKQRWSSAVALTVATALSFFPAAPAISQTRAPQHHVALYANVLLKGPLDEAVASFTQATGIAVDVTYDSNAALMGKLMPDTPDLFVALDLPAPFTLRDTGKYGDIHVVARTALCLLTPSALAQGRSFMDVLSDPNIGLIKQVQERYVTAYVDQVLKGFARLGVGMSIDLRVKARDSAPGFDAAAGAATLASSQAAFLTYCSFATAIAAVHPNTLHTDLLPASLNVQIPFDLIARTGAPPEAQRLQTFLLSDDAQALFQKAGFTGLHDALAPGQGAMTYNSYEPDGNLTKYWVHYIYRYPDGHVEEDDIPWPFYFPTGNDPFARGDSQIPLQPPPKGFKPDRPLKPLLLEYFPGLQVARVSSGACRGTATSVQGWGCPSTSSG
jgi:ABC-type molybdate transport system substrate-binding protein